MSTKSLFSIILKILGILFIKDIIATIPQLISVIFYMTDFKNFTEGVWTLSMTIAVLLVYVFVSYYFLFKSELVISKFKLDKGFDEETISLNVHRSTILSISIIVIAGLIIVDEFPTLLRQLFLYFQEKRLTRGLISSHTGISTLILSSTKIIIALLLIGNQRQIVNYIEYKRKK